MIVTEFQRRRVFVLLLRFQTHLSLCPCLHLRLQLSSSDPLPIRFRRLFVSVFFSPPSSSLFFNVIVIAIIVILLLLLIIIVVINITNCTSMLNTMIIQR